jgi:hypothetical protein
MKLKLIQLRHLIREEIKNSQHANSYVVVYNPETTTYGKIYTGTRQECSIKAKKLANLLNLPFKQLTQFYKQLDGQFTPYVTIFTSTKQINIDLNVTIEQTTHNAYEGQAIKVSWQDSEEEDPGFVPVEQSRFNVGDKVIMALFVENVPGGVMIVDENITFVEYWQANTYEEE